VSDENELIELIKRLRRHDGNAATDRWADTVLKHAAAAGSGPADPPTRYCKALVWPNGGYSSHLCMAPIGTCVHAANETAPRRKPDWRGWPGYFGRAVGSWLAADEPEEGRRLRQRLSDIYDEWVDAGRPDHDPRPAPAEPPTAAPKVGDRVVVEPRHRPDAAPLVEWPGVVTATSTTFTVTTDEGNVMVGLYPSDLRLVPGVARPEPETDR